MALIGIAFGNTSSSVAVTKPDGSVDVIANPDGDRSIPSTLSYVGQDEYHGSQALAQLVRNPNNTITNFRDFIGKSFSEIDPSFCSRSARPVYVEGKVGFQIERDGNTETFTVELATARHLTQMKAAAEDYMGSSVDGVVMTVPTDFTDSQKEALSSVASSVGLKIVQFISEPSAALLAHLSAEEKLSEDKVYVVADFGGIRSDAAVISVRGGILTVLATAHNHNLGGDQIDEALGEFFAKEFEKKYKADPRKSERSQAKLKAESILTKKTLSNVQTATISIDSLAEGFDFHTSINRLRFELVARNVFSQMTEFVESVVTKAGLENLDIDEVLLVGGTSQSPKLASNLQFIFPQTTTVVAPSVDNKAVDPSEANCRGAALQASMVETFEEHEVKEAVNASIVNTHHLSKPIGIKAADGSFIHLLAAETAFPIKKSIVVENCGENALVEVCEGERTIKETVVEAEKFSDEEDEDYSDEEPEVIKEVVYKPGELLAQLGLAQVADGKIEIIANITKDGTLQVTARSGECVVKGDITSA